MQDRQSHARYADCERAVNVPRDVLSMRQLTIHHYHRYYYKSFIITANINSIIIVPS